jgi:hypothetical protein
MTNKDEETIMEGMTYTQEELEGIYAELTKPASVPAEPPKDRKFGKAFFLTDDDFGKEVHNTITARYSDIEAIKKIGLGKGSNPFYVIAVNEVLREKFPQVRTATQADLEKILKEGLLELKGRYEDSGLVWRSNQDPNEYLAKNLFSQFEAKGVNLKQNSAYLIQLQNLSLKKDGTSPEKLSFVLPNLIIGEYLESPILNEVSQQSFESSDVDVATGITKKVSSSGSRKLYTRNWSQYSVRNSGLVGAYLVRGVNFDADNDGLSNSYDDGRVVLVSAEGGAP